MENKDNNSFIDNVSKAAAESIDVAFDSRKIFKDKLKKIIIFSIGGIVLLTLIIGAFKGKKAKLESFPASQTMDLDAGSKATDTDKMWRQNLEDKQSNIDKALQAQIEKVKNEISQKSAASDDKKTQEIKYLKEKLEFIQAELEDKNQDGLDLKVGSVIEKTPRITRHVINLNNSKNDKEYEPLKTADNYIPAGTMIEAATLNGLRASTSLQSMSNPDEILIQLVDYGILPNNFRNNLKDCVIVADAYGDLSSETVKIRTSKLSCIEIATGESVETDLVGMVVGGDGYAGIKGVVVSIDQKYLANASIFGIMSGIAGVGVRDNTSYNPFTVATGAVQPMNTQDKVKNNLLQGSSSSLDKLSDYYIAHAERIQPVIEIDRGRPVTVAVLKGAYIGTSALKKAESKKRDASIKRAASNMDDNLIDSMSIDKN
jgi:conjugal transfer pilus assembly protein TraB